MSRPPLESSNSPRFRKTRAKEAVAQEGRPPCPRSLTKEEKQRFRQICKELEARRSLSRGDGELIVLYCTTWTRWKKACADVDVRGEVITYVTTGKDGVEIQREKKNTFLLIAQESEKQMRGILTDLGFTPTSRERAKAIKGQEKPEPDEFEKLMNRPMGFTAPGAELPS
jgi:P27 family predicted phage terminase small subunit